MGFDLEVEDEPQSLHNLAPLQKVMILQYYLTQIRLNWLTVFYDFINKLMFCKKQKCVK